MKKPVDKKDCSSSYEDSSFGEDQKIKAIRKKSAKPPVEESSSDECDEPSSDEESPPKTTVAAKKRKIKVITNKSAKPPVEESSSDESSSDEESPPKTTVAIKQTPGKKRKVDSSSYSVDDVEMPVASHTGLKRFIPVYRRLQLRTSPARCVGSKTVYFSHLSPSQVKLSELVNILKGAGEIVKIWFALDKYQVFKGYGFVTFETAEAAQKATRFHGVTLNDLRVGLYLDCDSKVQFTQQSSKVNGVDNRHKAVDKGHEAVVKGVDRADDKGNKEGHKADYKGRKVVGGNGFNKPSITSIWQGKKTKFGDMNEAC